MSPTFYFSIGERPTNDDFAIARAVGQHELLVPAGSTAERTLWKLRPSWPELRVALDSGAWPVDNPKRLSIDAYWQAVQRWSRPEGTRTPRGPRWLIDWFASYDYIGDSFKTNQAYYHLLELTGLLACPDDRPPWAHAPLVPVHHYPDTHAAGLLYELEAGPDARRGDLYDPGGLDWQYDRPTVGIGGLVPARYSTDSLLWYERFVRELEIEVARWRDPFGDDEEEVDPPAIRPDRLQVHLFGIGRLSWCLRSSVVQSFDTSGPAQLARFGWQKLAPHFHPDRHGRQYDLSAPLLQISRSARLAYWLCAYRDRLGLPFTAIGDEGLRAINPLIDTEPIATIPWQPALF